MIRAGAVWLLVVAAWPAFAGEAPPAAATPVVVQLSSRDRAQLTTLACPGAGAAASADVRARRPSRGERTLQVDVRCAPHDATADPPTFRIVACDNAGGAWRCTSRGEGLRMTLPNAQVLSVLPQGVSAALAAEAVREAAKLTIRPFYRPAVNVMVDECSVGAAAAGASSRGMSSLEIRCGQAVIYLTKDCGQQGPCRYFIPFAQNY